MPNVTIYIPESEKYLFELAKSIDGSLSACILRLIRNEIESITEPKADK